MKKINLSLLIILFWGLTLNNVFSQKLSELDSLISSTYILNLNKIKSSGRVNIPLKCKINNNFYYLIRDYYSICDYFSKNDTSIENTIDSVFKNKTYLTINDTSFKLFIINVDSINHFNTIFPKIHKRYKYKKYITEKNGTEIKLKIIAYQFTRQKLYYKDSYSGHVIKLE